MHPSICVLLLVPNGDYCSTLVVLVRQIPLVAGVFIETGGSALAPQIVAEIGPQNIRRRIQIQKIVGDHLTWEEFGVNLICCMS